ncbi:MAG: hypothetical protein JXA13_06110 [Anaerolineales bacterium]|nr:hypothetical protein [Anaerolineales bacterium]
MDQHLESADYLTTITMPDKKREPPQKFYQNELLAGEPIIVSTIKSGYSISRDMPASDQDAHAMLDSLGFRVYFIVDIRVLTLTFDDIISASTIGARGEKPLWHHPKIKKLIFITESELAYKAAAGLRNLLFGYLDTLVFPTLEEALEYCRSH